MAGDLQNESSMFDAFKQQITVIYYALMISMGTVYVVFIIILAPQSPNLIEGEATTYLVAVPLINLAVVAASSFLFRNRVKAAIAAETVADKINAYRTGFLLRAAILEGLALLNAIAYFARHNMNFEIMFILVMLLYVISAYPNPDKLKREMGM